MLCEVLILRGECPVAAREHRARHRRPQFGSGLVEEVVQQALEAVDEPLGRRRLHVGEQADRLLGPRERERDAVAFVAALLHDAARGERVEVVFERRARHPDALGDVGRLDGPSSRR